MSRLLPGLIARKNGNERLVVAVREGNTYWVRPEHFEAVKDATWKERSADLYALMNRCSVKTFKAWLQNSEIVREPNPADFVAFEHGDSVLTTRYLAD